MIRVIVQDTDTGAEIYRDYDKSYFLDGEAELIGQNLYDQVDQLNRPNTEIK